MVPLSEVKPSLLIVEDDVDISEMLDAYFRVQGYEVFTADEGGKAIRECNRLLPDIIILDIRLPDMDGFEVAQKLRTQRRTKDVPIIFLTEKRARADRMHGLEIGADDYVTKPFDIQELRLRVRNALRRSTQGPLINSITGLPELALLDERLAACLKKDGWGLMLVSIDNLDSFRETYGFVAADDILRAVSVIIVNTLQEVGDLIGFVGQFSSSEFIVISDPQFHSALRECLESRLEQSLDYFYPLLDREPGYDVEKQLSFCINSITSKEGPFADLSQLKGKIAQLTVH